MVKISITLTPSKFINQGKIIQAPIILLSMPLYFVSGISITAVNFTGIVWTLDPSIISALSMSKAIDEYSSSKLLLWGMIDCTLLFTMYDIDTLYLLVINSKYFINKGIQYSQFF